MFFVIFSYLGVQEFVCIPKSKVSKHFGDFLGLESRCLSKFSKFVCAQKREVSM